MSGDTVVAHNSPRGEPTYQYNALPARCRTPRSHIRQRASHKVVKNPAEIAIRHTIIQKQYDYYVLKNKTTCTNCHISVTKSVTGM